MTLLPITGHAKQFDQVVVPSARVMTGTRSLMTMKISKMSYWQIKEAKLGLNYQASQLVKASSSSVTVALNGRPVASFQPKNDGKLHMKSVPIAPDQFKTTNTLEIKCNLLGKQHGKDALWLTVDESYLHYDYKQHDSKQGIANFIAHLTGVDTLAQSQSAIVVPDQPTDKELSAGLDMMVGLSNGESVPIMGEGQVDPKVTFKVLVAQVDRLPNDIKRHVKLTKKEHRGRLKLLTRRHQQVLVVTANSDKQLTQIAAHLTDKDLVKQTAQSATWVSGWSRRIAKKGPTERTLQLNQFPSQFQDNVRLVRSDRLAADDFAALSLLMRHVPLQSKGLKVSHEMPSKNELKKDNLIVIGTPKRNELIRRLNQHLNIKYHSKFDRFASNEKLRLTPDYAQQIGTLQLLKSPFNHNRVVLAVTGVHHGDVYRAALQFSQWHADKASDVLVTDQDNLQRSYRFAKRLNLQSPHRSQQQLLWFAALGLTLMIWIGYYFYGVSRNKGSIFDE